MQFESRPGDPELGRLVDSTIWINDAHPAYARAAASRSSGYHTALTVALALAPLAVGASDEHAFITQFLAHWGGANGVKREEAQRARKASALANAGTPVTSNAGDKAYDRPGSPHRSASGGARLVHIVGCAHHSQGSAPRDITHGRAVPIELGERLLDEGSIALQEPVAEQELRLGTPTRSAVPSLDMKLVDLNQVENVKRLILASNRDRT